METSVAWSSTLSAPILASLITAIVTLIGIFVSYHLSKKNLAGEIDSIKTQHAVERMQELPARVAAFLDEVNNGSINAEEMGRLLSDVYAYGSPDAIKILVSFQEMNYSVGVQPNPVDIKTSYRLLSHLSLLISQLKYDLSGQYTDPEFFFRLKIKDYGQSGVTAKPILKKLVEDMDLDKRLIIKA